MSPLTEADRAHMRPVRWKVFSIPSNDHVQIYSQAGYCLDIETEPRYGRIQVVGRADGTYITAFMVPSRPKPSAKGKFCSGVGSPLLKTIAVDRDASGPKLYDASTDPPTLRGRLPSNDRLTSDVSSSGTG